LKISNILEKILVKKRRQEVSKKYLYDEIVRKLTDLQQSYWISPTSLEMEQMGFNSLSTKLFKMGFHVKIGRDQPEILSA
jgi:hypothetical protein